MGQMTCPKCQSFIVYPEKYMGKCPRCEILMEVQGLRAEVNCRIEHGADSGGHLEYVQNKLDAILAYEPRPSPFRENGEWPHLEVQTNGR